MSKFNTPNRDVTNAERLLVRELACKMRELFVEKYKNLRIIKGASATILGSALEQLADTDGITEHEDYLKELSDFITNFSLSRKNTDNSQI